MKSEGQTYLKLDLFSQAEKLFLSIILTMSQVEAAFMGLLESYSARGMVDEGYVFVGDQFTRRKQITEGLQYYKKALQVKHHTLFS